MSQGYISASKGVGSCPLPYSPPLRGIRVELGHQKIHHILVVSVAGGGSSGGTPTSPCPSTVRVSYRQH